MRILSISHSCVVPEYRQRHAEVAKNKDIDLYLLTPFHWQQFNKLCCSPAKKIDHSYTLIRKQPFTFGLTNHGLRNASHLYKGLSKLIDRLKPDILELWEEPFAAVSWQATRHFLKINPKGKVIFFSAQNVMKWRPFPYSYFEKNLFHRASACFAMNKDVPSILAEKGWHKRNLILPLGIDMSDYQYIPSLNSSTKKEPVIAYLGKIDSQKGVEDLIDAAILLQRRNISGFKLRITGTGPLKNYLSEKISASFLNIIMEDPIPHNQVPNYLSEIDILVMPSRTMPGLKEQFGRAAIEAMAAGRALVVSDSGELPNIAEGAGHVFPEGNTEALADLLYNLLRSPEVRIKSGIAAQKKANRCYTWKSIAEKQLNLYRALIQN